MRNTARKGGMAGTEAGMVTAGSRHQGSQERKLFGTLIRHALSLLSPREPHPIAMIGFALWRLLVPCIGLPTGTAHARLPTSILAVSLAPKARNADEERPLAPATSKIVKFGFVHPLARADKLDGGRAMGDCPKRASIRARGAGWSDSVFPSRGSGVYYAAKLIATFLPIRPRPSDPDGFKLPSTL